MKIELSMVCLNKFAKFRAEHGILFLPVFNPRKFRIPRGNKFLLSPGLVCQWPAWRSTWSRNRRLLTRCFHCRCIFVFGWPSCKKTCNFTHCNFTHYRETKTKWCQSWSLSRLMGLLASLPCSYPDPSVQHVECLTNILISGQATRFNAGFTSLLLRTFCLQLFNLYWLVFWLPISCSLVALSGKQLLYFGCPKSNSNFHVFKNITPPHPHVSTWGTYKS